MEKFDRRDFLKAAGTAAGSALFLNETTKATNNSSILEPLPARANKDNCKNIIFGPQIPVITHLKEDLSLDLDAIRKNVNNLVERGFVTGKGVLLAVGAGGDFPMLTVEERKLAGRAIFEAAAGRVPVIFACQDTNPKVSLELAKFADEVGFYAIQMSPPYYYHPSDDDVLRLFRSVNDVLSRTGIMVYNTWWHGYNIEFPVMDKLVDLERVVCIKWSHASGGLDYAKGVKRYFDRVSMIDNCKLCVWTHILGGHGFISHFASIWPEHELKVWELCGQGKHKEAEDMYARDNYPWVAFRGKMGGQTGGESPTVKAGMELTGRYGGPCRPPSRCLNTEERNELKGILKNIGVPGV